jgi:hypothetical protein
MVESAPLAPASVRPDRQTIAVHTTVFLPVPSPEDSGLAERLEQGLSRAGYAPLRDIKVLVHARVVRLIGRVPSYHLKQVAQEIARATVGVSTVRNQLKVLAPN